jgi:hypothetical protein
LVADAEEGVIVERAALASALEDRRSDYAGVDGDAPLETSVPTSCRTDTIAATATATAATVTIASVVIRHRSLPQSRTGTRPGT